MGAYERLAGDCPGDGGTGRDGIVDLTDYAGFETCVGGPADQLTAPCQCFDLNGNGEIDLRDFALFQVTFTGS